MTRSMIFRLVLVGMTTVGIQRANAGSAVVHSIEGHTVYSFGHPKSVAIHQALETARLYGWTDAKLMAASDATGYGAIAVAQKGKGSVLGAALGRVSREDAEKRAIEVCLKGGGAHPVVRWEWYG
jgi:hypothetical protein